MWARARAFLSRNEQTIVDRGLEFIIWGILLIAGILAAQYRLIPEMKAAEGTRILYNHYERQHVAMTRAMTQAELLKIRLSRFRTLSNDARIRSFVHLGASEREAYNELHGLGMEIRSTVLVFSGSPFLHKDDQFKIYCTVANLARELNLGRSSSEPHEPHVFFVERFILDLETLARSHYSEVSASLNSEKDRQYGRNRSLKDHHIHYNKDRECRLLIPRQD